MNKIGLKNAGLRVQVYTWLLHQTGPDYLLFILASRQSPNCWLCYEKLKLFAFHIILSPTPLHHLPIIWKAFITKSFSFLKSHSCPTYITFKWIQNLCWSPRIWTTESRYSTFISFALGQSLGPRGAKSPPEGNLKGRGGCISQCIPTRGSVRPFSQH